MESVTEQQFDSVADIRQHLRRGGQIYQQLRVHCETAGTQTYMVPVPDDELEEYMLTLEIEELLRRPDIQEVLRRSEMEEALMIRELEESLRSFEANGIQPFGIQPFNVVECMRIRVGDLNGDGRITEDDVDLLQAHVMGRGSTLPASVQARIAGGAGNITGNPTISPIDVMMLRAYVRGDGNTLPSDVQARLAWHPLRIGDLTGDRTITMMDVDLLRIYVMGMGHTLPSRVLARIAEGAGYISGAPTISAVDVLMLRAYVMGNGDTLPPHVQARLSWHSRRYLPFAYTRIRCSGRSLADSIVIVLLGDGFNPHQYGTWPNPAQNTALWHADRAMTSMFNTHPFSLFRDYFIVYLIHTHGTGPNDTSYLRTVRANGNLFNINTAEGADVRQYRIRQLANALVPEEYQTMIQVISNATDAWPNGSAWMSWTLNPEHNTPPLFSNANIAVTSIRNNTNPVGGSNNNWPSGTGWHGTFIHEFGHSFGRLVDEHSGGNRSTMYANIARIQDPVDENVRIIKWRHWLGHRSVRATPILLSPRPNISNDTYWALPASICIMANSFSSRNFCGVCTAELVRRLAFVSGEPFFGQRPDIARPFYAIPRYTRVTFPSGTIRILDSAFHGNTNIRELDIPASVTEIGDFAFIGATELRTIISRNPNPPRINSTTFEGLNRAGITVQVPSGRRTAYINAGWTGFNIVDRITGF